VRTRIDLKESISLVSISSILNPTHSLYLFPLSGPLINDVKQSVCEKDLSCRKLKEQLDVLERETTAKLSQMEQYNREIKVTGFSYIPSINLDNI